MKQNLARQCGNILGDLGERIIFYVTKLTLGDRKTQNRTTTTKESEKMIKNLSLHLPDSYTCGPLLKILGLDCFMGELFQLFK